MQKFDLRDTYTPTDISHVRSNCDQVLKGSREKAGVLDLKTVSNNPDATLTAGGQAGQNPNVSVVYVLNIKGKPLMPTSPRKARILLKKGIRSHIKNISSRFIKGFQRFDKVLYKNIECFIFGRRKTGYFDLRKLNGLKIHASAKLKNCIL